MKKHLLSTFVLLLISVFANAQFGTFINFESVTDTLIKIDTSQHPNIWQIGKPHKTIFDTAYSAPNALVTDTLNPYPVNNVSSFQFTMYDSAYISGHYDSWDYSVSNLSFMHKLDTDTLHDGGYIEYSIDSGATWKNVSNFNYGGYNNSTLFDGTPGYTGKTNGWRNQYIMFWWCGDIAPHPAPHSAIVRFTFKSDNINNNREGWMIDDIRYQNWICEGVPQLSQEDNITIAPNPFTMQTTINFSATDNHQAKYISIIDVLGNEIVNAILPATTTSYTIDKGTMQAGIYFVRIQEGAGNVINKKIVVH